MEALNKILNKISQAVDRNLGFGGNLDTHSLSHKVRHFFWLRFEFHRFLPSPKKMPFFYHFFSRVGQRVVNHVNIQINLKLMLFHHFFYGKNCYAIVLLCATSFVQIFLNFFLVSIICGYNPFGSQSHRYSCM